MNNQYNYSYNNGNQYDNSINNNNNQSMGLINYLSSFIGHNSLIPVNLPNIDSTYNGVSNALVPSHDSLSSGTDYLQGLSQNDTVGNAFITREDFITYTSDSDNEGLDYSHIPSHDSFSSDTEDNYTLNDDTSNQFLSSDDSDDEDLEYSITIEIDQDQDDENLNHMDSNEPPSAAAAVVLKSPKVSKTRTIWNDELDRKLNELVQTNGPKNWHGIALQMGGKSKNQCRSRYHQYIKDKKEVIVDKIKHWSRDEDLKLTELVNTHGRQWELIAKEMGTRNKIQVTNRYHYLKSANTPIKNTRWSLEEDLELISLVKLYGTSDWAFISSMFSTERSRVNCCNRYNGYLKYQLSLYNVEPVTKETSTPSQFNQISSDIPTVKEEPLSISPSVLPSTLLSSEFNQSIDIPTVKEESISDNEELLIPQLEPLVPIPNQLSSILESIQNNINLYNSLYNSTLILKKE